MKDILGLITAIATVAGIATIASKSEREAREAEERQQRIELEKQLLQLESEERNRRFQQERENQEYQRKLENAPKKAIYKPVTLQCPFCNAIREIDEKTHQIKCPYCGKVEMLIVERFEIDQQAFQKQLREEQEQIAAIKTEKKRMRVYNKMILIFTTILIFILLILSSKPTICLTLSIPTLLILFILLYHRFHTIGKKVWHVIRIPLVCIFLFPIPLTLLLMKNEKLTSKFSKIVRVVLSISTWIIYIALIVYLCMLYVTAFKNELNTNIDYQYNANEYQEEINTESNTHQSDSASVVNNPATNKKKFGIL